VVGFPELLSYAQRRFAVLAQEGQEILPGNEIRLSRFNYFSRQFIRLPRDSSWQTQHLSWFCDSDN
jgi:hypothetical protein